MILLALTVGLTSSKCTSEKKNPSNFAQTTLTVENTVSMDKEQVFLNHGNNFRYFETTAVLDNYVDADDEHNVVSVENVFQVLFDEDEKSIDTKVLIFSHNLDGGDVDIHEHAFWVGNEALNDKTIKLTFKDAIQRVYETNCIKPHTRYVVLRKELGPVDANPQYIFGKGKLYVDAVTGSVSETNPAFGPEAFSMPLGEWP